jgi:hypothetical protein
MQAGFKKLDSGSRIWEAGSGYMVKVEQSDIP